MTRFVNAVIALVVASFLASCSSSGGGNNGALAFGQPSYPVTSGSTIALPLTLSGNTSTSGVTVTIASSSSTVAVPVYTPCVLSDEPGSTSSCEIQVKGLASGSATISASAPGVKGASATVSVSTTPVPGALTFTPSAETVVVGSVQHVTVKLSGSSGVSGQAVSIASSSPTLASVTPSQVVLSTDAPAQLITVTGVAEGSASITASSSGYVDATNAVTITSGTPVPGTLAFGGNVYLAVGGSTGGTLTLVGSSNVAPFTATLVTANTSATISPTSCPLSTTTRTCPFTITGSATGSDKITASASGYGPATMIATVSATPVPGNLYFAMAQETVVVGAPATVNLVYSGGSGVMDLPVALSTNNGNATISPTICPMSNTGGSSTCPITITGVSAGSTTITAAATGYPSAQNTVSVQSSGQVVYGTLSFASANVPVPLNGSVQLALTLNGSSNVTSLPVSLAALPTGIVTVATTPSPCVLSTSSNTCTVTLTGAATGSTTLTATSTAGPPTPIQASAAVTVGAAPSPSLVFAPDPLVLMSNSIAGISVTLSMANPPVNPVQIALTYPQPVLAMSVTPDPCVLSAATPTCAISINNTSVGNPTGQYSFTATPLNSSIPAVTLPVYISTLQPVSRTLTVTNNCPYTVWAGMSGGAVASVSPIAAAGQQACPAGTSFATGYCCPTGSSSVAGDYCFWSNPAPTNGYMLPTTTGLRSTQFVIPSNSLTTAPNLTHVWSGGIMARLGCVGGNCTIGSCNDNGSGSLACAVGVGFNAPQTVAEFTLLQGGPDAYDVQLIAGVTVPTSMGPTNPMQDAGNPFIGGVAGSTTSQVGRQYTLNPATWTFTPPQIGTPASSAYFILVSGSSGATDACSNTTPCATGVCGYAMNSITNVPTASTPGPTYKLACGTQLGYLTADAIWKGNPTGSNASPIAFSSQPAMGTQSATLPYPNVNGYTLAQFVDCPNPPMNSGYQPTTTYPTACGCTDWTGIATPTSTCQGTGATGYTGTTPGIGFNSAWTQEVLPLLTWLKQGCPTCYTYQFDDASSSFQAYQAASPTNGSNSTNYTITFCP